MNDEEWEKFLNTRARTAQTWYKLRRICLSCGQPIFDRNKTGYCPRCKQKIRYAQNRRKKEGDYEGDEHRALKQIARDFLLALGCTDIYEDSLLGSRKRTPYVSVKINVLGVKGGKRIAVECGGSLMSKLGRAVSFVDELYILPWGETKPFLWNHGMRICPHCGHKV